MHPIVKPAIAVQPASTLNPEAGEHVVSGSPGELAAAERAIRRSWSEFPYYARRYGARGRSFSSSDSGWLITLCDMPPGAAAQQALWLGTVLAARGMPRWLLEVHLGLLADELTRARPGPDAARYRRLNECAAALRDRRLARLDEETFARIERDFDARVSDTDRRLHRRTGGILAAAVTDERDGIDLAVTSVVSWLTDASRFSDQWVTAVHEAVAEARALAR